MKKCVCVILSFCMLLLLINDTARADEKEELNLHARSALLMDAESGRVLYEKDGYIPYAVASTTKILTAILILENCDPEAYVTVSALAAAQPKVKLYVKEGESYRIKDLLYSLLLESHNDVAVVLAEGMAGSVDAFAEQMNAFAKKLGCETAHFITPNGLDAVDESGPNVASAYDLARITSYALQNPVFCEIIQTGQYSFTDREGKRNITVNNADSFLSQYDGAIGVKTGFTNQAGYCFVGAVKQEDGILISVVLGCGWPPGKNLKWQDTKALMDYGAENFYRDEAVLYEKDGEVKLQNGIKESVPYRGEAVKQKLCLNQSDVVFRCSLVVCDMEAPVQKQMKIGWQRIYVNQKPVLEQNLYISEDCREKVFGDVLTEVWHNFLL